MSGISALFDIRDGNNEQENLYFGEAVTKSALSITDIEARGQCRSMAHATHHLAFEKD